MLIRVVIIINVLSCGRSCVAMRRQYLTFFRDGALRGEFNSDCRRVVNACSTGHLLVGVHWGDALRLQDSHRHFLVRLLPPPLARTI